MSSYPHIASTQVSIKRTEEEQAATVLTTIKESAGTPPWTQKEKEDNQNAWDDFSKLLTAHMNCEYNACGSRGISARHSPDYPFLEQYNKSIKANEVSTNVQTSDEVEPLTNESMDIDIKEEDNYDTTEAGCDKHHPKRTLLHWTGCYIDDCKIHINKRYEPKPQLWTQVCTYCRQYGHKVINCDAHDKMIKAKKAKNESLAIHVRPPLVCTYCKRNGHLKEKCYKKLMDEYRMFNDIYKLSSTRAEVSTSSAPTTPESPATPPQVPSEEKTITGSPQAWGPIEAPITKEWLPHIQNMYRECLDF